MQQAENKKLCKNKGITNQTHSLGKGQRKEATFQVGSLVGTIQDNIYCHFGRKNMFKKETIIDDKGSFTNGVNFKFYSL